MLFISLISFRCVFVSCYYNLWWIKVSCNIIIYWIRLARVSYSWIKKMKEWKTSVLLIIFLFFSYLMIYIFKPNNKLCCADNYWLLNIAFTIKFLFNVYDCLVTLVIFDHPSILMRFIWSFNTHCLLFGKNDRFP